MAIDYGAFKKQTAEMFDEICRPPADRPPIKINSVEAIQRAAAEALGVAPGYHIDEICRPPADRLILALKPFYGTNRTAIPAPPVPKPLTMPHSDWKGQQARAGIPDFVAGCRLGCICKAHNPPKPAPYVPSIDDFDLLPDA
jgi:hypothetical protein